MISWLSFAVLFMWEYVVMRMIVVAVIENYEIDIVLVLIYNILCFLFII